MFEINLNYLNSVLPVKLNLVGSFYFDRPMLTGGFECFDEMPKNIAQLLKVISQRKQMNCNVNK